MAARPASAMPEPTQRNTALWLPVAGLYLASAAGAVYGPAKSLAQGGSLSLAQVLLSDAALTAGMLLFLHAALAYGSRWHPGTAPYTGAWLGEPGGRPLLPAGFSRYLPLAGLLAFLLPLGAALLMLRASGGGGAAGALLGGYLLTFLVQALLETKYFHRNPLSPAIPFVFAPYRFWQLARSLWALGTAQAVVAAAPSWAGPFLVALLAFWVFDFGVTSIQLPWVFNWHLMQRGGSSAAAEKSTAAAGEQLTAAKEE